MKRYGRWVWYWSYRLTWGDDVRSRDLTQDTWLLVWDNLYRLRTDASVAELRAWLKALVRTAASRRWRQDRKAAAATNDDIDADTSLRQMRETLDELMAYLPDDERRLITLLLDGYRINEAAQLLAISPAAAAQRHHRAVQHMKEISKQHNIHLQ